MRSRCLVVIGFFWVFCAIGQPLDQGNLYNRLVEIAEQGNELSQGNAEFNTLLEDLVYYSKHPLNLNTADQEDFISLGFLSENDILMILDYRAALKEYVEVDELKLAGLSVQKVEDLKWFVRVKSIEDRQYLRHPKELLRAGSHQLFLRHSRILETQKGYTGPNPNFQGSPDKLYLRYNYTFERKLKIGVVLEKDEGETFFKGSNSARLTEPLGGFDYRNAYVSYRSKGIAKHTVLGAYSLQLGQGLVCWTGFSIGKSAYILQSKKLGEELLPYSSVNEARYLSGAATHLSLGKFTLTPYLSLKNIDANVVLGEDQSQEVSSFQQSGLHRTPAEITDEDANREWLGGMSVGRKIKKLHVRANYQFARYDKSVQKATMRHQIHRFWGDQLHAASLDYNYASKGFSFFGEHAVQSKNKTAHLIGVTSHINSRVDLMAIYRNYQSGYFTPYNNGFGESATTNNEQGLVIGFQVHPTPKWSISSYLDQYKKPWASFRADSPVRGVDGFIQVNHDLNPTIQHYVRLKHETTQQNSSKDAVTQQTERLTNWRLRYHLNIDPHYRLNLKSRMEVSGTNEERGYLLYQDVVCTFFKHQLKLTGRYAHFKTGSFQNAIYAFESDVLFFFNIPAYFNQGSRFYLMATFDLGEHTRVWMRYSRWIYDQTAQISSGNSQIDGNTKSDFKIQVRWLLN